MPLARVKACDQQCRSCNREHWPRFAMALEHPMGASGTRPLCTLLWKMRRDWQESLVTLCIGDGMGIAVAGER